MTVVVDVVIGFVVGVAATVVVQECRQSSPCHPPSCRVPFREPPDNQRVWEPAPVGRPRARSAGSVDSLGFFFIDQTSKHHKHVGSTTTRDY
jgi:hypothetical protein